MRTPAPTPVFERPELFRVHQLTMSLELKQKAKPVVSSTLGRGLIIDRALAEARAGSSRAQAYHGDGDGDGTSTQYKRGK